MRSGGGGQCVSGGAVLFIVDALEIGTPVSGGAQRRGGRNKAQCPLPLVKKGRPQCAGVCEVVFATSKDSVVFSKAKRRGDWAYARANLGTCSPSQGRMSKALGMGGWSAGLTPSKKKANLEGAKDNKRRLAIYECEVGLTCLCGCYIYKSVLCC